MGGVVGGRECHLSPIYSPADVYDGAGISSLAFEAAQYYIIIEDLSLCLGRLLMVILSRDLVTLFSFGPFCLTTFYRCVKHMRNDRWSLPHFFWIPHVMHVTNVYPLLCRLPQGIFLVYGSISVGLSLLAYCLIYHLI